MKNRNSQRGYTLYEVLALFWVLACLAASAGTVWVVCHFIAKFW